MTNFGTALRAMRKAASVKQGSLWMLLVEGGNGIGVNHVYEWESGRRPPPSAAVMQSLAKACNASPVPLYLAAAKDTGELRIPCLREVLNEEDVKAAMDVAMKKARP